MMRSPCVPLPVETSQEITPAMQIELKDRVVLVTGGTSGIGLAIVRAFAAAQARVYTSDVTSRPQVEAELRELGVDVQSVDVRDVSALRQWIDRAAIAAGRLDVLVNNAGVGLVKQCPEVTEAEWDRCLDTNLKAAFFASGAAIPHFQRTGGGSIINIASNAGILPRAHDPVYSISKLALVGLTRSLALSHSKDRIRVNSICPGPVQGTEMIEAELRLHPDYGAAVQKFIAASPLARAHGRMISVDEVAACALFLASDASLMITGTQLAIDGGKSLGVPPAP
jgi:3-oxoacyl-[acyl-carrier protein] reductase